MSFDIDEYGAKLSDDKLVDIIKNKRDEVLVLGALKELFRRKTTKKLEISKYVLDDELQENSVKKTVVAHIGTECLVEGQELLSHHLKTKNASLFNKIVQSLGKIGNEQLLKRLEDIESPDANVSKSLDFAKSLISYRLRLNRNLIKLSSDNEFAKINNGIPINIKEIEPSEVREALKQVKKELPCVPLASEPSIKLSWPSADSLMIFTDKFHEFESLRSIQETSALPLIILEKATSLGVYFLSHYFFTHPSEDRKDVVLIGTNPTGTLTNGGNVKITENGFEFKLRSVVSHYSLPIEMEWNYDPNKQLFKFTKAVSNTKIETDRTKAKIPDEVSLDNRFK